MKDDNVIKRPRGRPRKEKIETPLVPNETKRPRGRPPKRPTGAQELNAYDPKKPTPKGEVIVLELKDQIKTRWSVKRQGPKPKKRKKKVDRTKKIWFKNFDIIYRCWRSFAKNKYFRKAFQPKTAYMFIAQMDKEKAKDVRLLRGVANRFTNYFDHNGFETIWNFEVSKHKKNGTDYRFIGMIFAKTTNWKYGLPYVDNQNGKIIRNESNVDPKRGAKVEWTKNFLNPSEFRGIWNDFIYEEQKRLANEGEVVTRENEDDNLIIELYPNMITKFPKLAAVIGKGINKEGFNRLVTVLGIEFSYELKNLLFGTSVSLEPFNKYIQLSHLALVYLSHKRWNIRRQRIKPFRTTLRIVNSFLTANRWDVIDRRDYIKPTFIEDDTADETFIEDDIESEEFDL